MLLPRPFAHKLFSVTLNLLEVDSFLTILLCLFFSLFNGSISSDDIVKLLANSFNKLYLAIMDLVAYCKTSHYLSKLNKCNKVLTFISTKNL